MALCCVAGSVSPASAQTSYYLQNETDWSEPPFLLKLRTTPPTQTAGVLQTADLKGQPPGAAAIRVFRTIAGVPNLSGTLPSGSTITVTLWMRKTASFGTVFPQATVGVNWGSTPVPLCQATGIAGQSPTQEITTTVAPITISCQTTSPVTMTATDRVYVIAGYNMTAGPGNKTMRVELRFDGSYHSRAVVPTLIPPTPSITSLNPASGPLNWPVTITGANFGATAGTVRFFDNQTAQIVTWSATSIDVRVPAGAASGPVTVTTAADVTSNGAAFTLIGPPTLTSLTPATAHISEPVTIAGTNFLDQQATSTVTFNGMPATPSSWTNTSIQVPVPSDATSGNVVVRVSDQASNPLPFTVIPPPALAGVYPAAAQAGASVSIVGARFGAAQGASSVTFNGIPAAAITSWSDTHISAIVPAGDATGDLVVRVANQASNALPFTILTAGAIGGTITRVTGGTAISGASVQAVLTGVITGTATTAPDGTYAIPGLDPGTYDVRVFADGFSSEVRSGTVVAATATTTVDVAMWQPGSISGTVTQADGATPIAAAAVTVFLGGIEKGRTQSDASGAYSIPSLRPGAYTVQAVNVGNRTREQGATILEATNTVANLAMDPAATGPVTYAYDELGRLVMVVDPSGDAATYSYDAVGNILAIGRVGAGTVSIAEFTPNGAPVGASVTLYGTGFSPTAGQNSVTFNGVAATVTFSTSTHLQTTVPVGASTGPIGVVTPNGAATSATSFVVGTASGAPTITGFTPAVATTGTALVVDGTHFDPVPANDRLTLNIAFANPSGVTSTSLTTTIPAAATSGRITVATPEGTAVSTDDLFIPPSGFQPSDVEFTGRMGYGEAGRMEVPSISAGKIALVVFDGQLGRRVSLRLSNATISSGDVKLYGATGTLLDQTSLVFNLLGPEPLYHDGSYLVLVDPSGSATGSITLTLYDVVDIVGTLTPDADGDSVTAEIETPGQNARYTFAGTQNQRVSLLIGPGPVGPVEIQKPDGFALATSSTAIFNRFIDATLIPQTGTYAVVADPMNAGTGDIPLTLYDVPPDLSGSTVINDPEQVVAIATPGQNATYSVTAESSQTVRVLVTNNTYDSTTFGGCVTVKLVQGTTSLESVSSCSAAFELPAHAIAAGSYAVQIDPQSNATGSLRFRVVTP